MTNNVLSLSISIMITLLKKIISFIYTCYLAIRDPQNTILLDFRKKTSIIYLKYLAIKHPNISLIYRKINNIKNIKLNTKKIYINNEIIIKDYSSIYNCLFYIFGSNNKIIIHNNVLLQNVTFYIEDNFNTIEIGENTTFHGNIQLAACEGTNIKIGNDCMFSHDIFIRTTDSHPILNEKEERINYAKDITIGNHVWIGMQSLILKGSFIPSGSIVSARCTFTSSTEKKDNSLYVGSPAKIIKNNITWDRNR